MQSQNTHNNKKKRQWSFDPWGEARRERETGEGGSREKWKEVKRERATTMATFFSLEKTIFQFDPNPGQHRIGRNKPEKMLAPSLTAPATSAASTCAVGTSPRCLAAAAAAAPPHHIRRLRRIRSSSSVSVSSILRQSLIRASTSDEVDALPIEGIPPRRGGECDDDVCTVSPAVEATVRSLGRDVARCAGSSSFFAASKEDNKKKPRSTWNRLRFSPGVRYTDGFRTFVGVDGYEKLTWIRELLDKPDVVS